MQTQPKGFLQCDKCFLPPLPSLLLSNKTGLSFYAFCFALCCLICSLPLLPLFRLPGPLCLESHSRLLLHSALTTTSLKIPGKSSLIGLSFIFLTLLRLTRQSLTNSLKVSSHFQRTINSTKQEICLSCLFVHYHMPKPRTNVWGILCTPYIVVE